MVGPAHPTAKFRALLAAFAMEPRAARAGAPAIQAILSCRSRSPACSSPTATKHLIDIERALPSVGAELVCLKRFFFMNLSRRYSSGAGVSTTGLHHFGGLSEVST